jgi:tripartite-type tricarboxylate transporter receptor subunit TctC
MRALLAAFAAAATLAAAPHASSQQYASKPIRIVVPYAAGGTSDILARQTGPKITEAWGRPLVVANKPSGARFE